MKTDNKMNRKTDKKIRINQDISVIILYCNRKQKPPKENRNCPPSLSKRKKMFDIE